jgi:glycosyltransferase involved in cell wall biosynthesis
MINPLKMTKGDVDNVQLSIIIPLYNENESIRELHDKICSVCEREKILFEIIYIDDGSNDGSFDVLTSLHREDSRAKVIQFRKNFGKSEALSAGFSNLKGRMIITMDADLQDDPAEIPRLISKLNEGYDLVSGWKKKRNDPFTKRIPSKFWNRTTSLLTGIKIHDFNCGLKIYRKEVVETLNIYGELHRYPIKHHPRKHGKSKFGAARFARGAFDLLTVIFLTRYKTRPLHLFGIWGFFSFLAGFIISFSLGYQKLVLDKNLSNRPLLFLGVLLIIVGVQFFSIGLLGEMITSSRQKMNTYIIKQQLE